MRAATISILSLLCGLFAQETTATESCLSSSTASRVLKLWNGDLVPLRHEMAEAVILSDGAVSKLSSMFQEISESSSERRGIGRDILALLVLDDAIREDRQDVISWLFQESIVNDASMLLWHYIDENDEAMVDRILKFPAFIIAKANDGSATPTWTKLYDLGMHNGQELHVAIRNNNAQLVKHLVIHHHASLERALDDAARNNDRLVLKWIFEGFQSNCDRFSWLMTGFPQITENMTDLMFKFADGSFSDVVQKSEDERRPRKKQKRHSEASFVIGGVALPETEAQELVRIVKLLQRMKEQNNAAKTGHSSDTDPKRPENELMSNMNKNGSDTAGAIGDDAAATTSAAAAADQDHAAEPVKESTEEKEFVGDGGVAPDVSTDAKGPLSDDDNAIAGDDDEKDAVMQNTDEENCKDDNGGRSKHVHEHGDQNGAD